MNGRKKITVDMIEAALRKGWNANQTARHYGMHRKSIEAAADRFGIILPLVSYSPMLANTFSPRALASASLSAPAAPQKKSNAVWSASKASIERALEKMQRDKRLQTMSNSDK